MRLIRQADPEVWHRSGIGLQTLYHVLRCGPACTREEVMKFLDRIATQIDDQVSALTTVGGLAGALYAFASGLPEDLTNRFLVSALQNRLARELKTALSNDVETWTNLISLFGSASALGFQMDRVNAKWSSSSDISSILELRAPGVAATAIGPLQVQLWLGLREMARLRSDLISISAGHGETILALWRVGRVNADKQVAPRHQKLT